jgi:hypothetical protein
MWKLRPLTSLWASTAFTGMACPFYTIVTVVWGVTPCIFCSRHRRFGRTRCLQIYFQVRRVVHPSSGHKKQEEKILRKLAYMCTKVHVYRAHKTVIFLATDLGGPQFKLQQQFLSSQWCSKLFLEC